MRTDRRSQPNTNTNTNTNANANTNADTRLGTARHGTARTCTQSRTIMHGYNAHPCCASVYTHLYTHVQHFCPHMSTYRLQPCSNTRRYSSVTQSQDWGTLFKTIDKSNDGDLSFEEFRKALWHVD